ncbi:hypothetical protein B0O99DRAFT_695901 [Bisporella sp. PMI_857]|nr:hypothetical protein B0O99DRAFT_695901 [Bisporella sp. PMI_857]
MEPLLQPRGNSTHDDITSQEIPGSSGKWECKGKPKDGVWESSKANLDSMPTVQDIVHDIKTCGLVGSMPTLFYSFGITTAQAREWRDNTEHGLGGKGIMFNDALDDDWWKMVEKFKPIPPLRDKALVARFSAALAIASRAEIFLVTGSEVANGGGAYTVPHDPKNHWRKWEFPKVQRNALVTRVTVVDGGTSPFNRKLGWLPFHEDKYPGLPENDADNEDTGKIPPGAATATKSQPSTPKPTVPARPKISQNCHGLGSDKYIAQAKLSSNIKAFCSEVAKQRVQDRNSGSIERKYNVDTPESISISINWPPGRPFKLEEASCLKYMNIISNGCDGNNPNNPMNWKGGGSIQVDLVKYNLNPTTVRQPFRKQAWAHCKTKYDFLYDSYWIQGSGWASSDFGHRLKSKLNGCAGSNYHFSYRLNKDGSEWGLSGRAPIWKKKCIKKAIRSAGGPSDIECSGNG